MRQHHKKNKLPPFVAIPWDVLNSRAYIDLTPSAAKALPYFLGKIKISFSDPMRYSQEFSFSYKEGKRYGFANGTHFRNICQLMEKGFIDAVCKGGKRGVGLSSSFFKPSQRWRQYGTEDFKLISWKDIYPEFKKQKPTSKVETSNSKNGNEKDKKNKNLPKLML